jgi:hypothetical protein
MQESGALDREQWLRGTTQAAGSPAREDQGAWSAIMAPNVKPTVEPTGGIHNAEHIAVGEPTDDPGYPPSVGSVAETEIGGVP